MIMPSSTPPSERITVFLILSASLTKREDGGEAACSASLAMFPISTNDGASITFRTIEGQARYLASKICRLETDRPLCIVGYENSAAVLYETATQLIGADREVAFLGICECESEQLEASCGSRDDHISLIYKSLEYRLAYPVWREKQGCDDPAHCATVRFKSASHFLASRKSDSHMRYSGYPLPIPLHLFSAKACTEGSPMGDWNGLKCALNLGLKMASVDDARSPFGVSSRRRSIAEVVMECTRSRHFIPEHKYDPLILLQAGRDNRTPVICVPGAGGTVASLESIVGELDRAVTAYGLEPRGLDGVLTPHITVEAASSAYVRAVLPMLIGGEAYLLGHSFGGIISFEMAKELAEHGIEVPQVIMIDTEPPGYDQAAAVNEYTREEIVQQYLGIFELLGYEFGERGRDLCHCDDIEEGTMLQELLVNHGIVSRHIKRHRVRGPFRAFAAAARSNYIPRSAYMGRVILITLDAPELNDADNQLRHTKMRVGWGQWAPNVIACHAPGNHMTILKSPHVCVLARILQRLMADQRGVKTDEHE